MDPENLSADDQALFDQMRAADSAPSDEGGGAPPAPAAPDPAPPASQAAVDGDKRPQMVPHAALHEERERRKEIERTLAEERNARKVLEDRTNLVLQQLGQARAPDPAPAPALPEVEKDPVGHIVGRLQQVAEWQRQQEQVAQQNAQQQQQAAAVGALQQRALAMEQAFRAETPDYDAAVAHLRATRDRDLALAGFDDPAQRQTLMMQEALGIAARALSLGRNPAAMLYEQAKHRGYTAAAPDSAPPPDPAARIQKAAEGQQQARSLSQVRGTGPAPINANTLLNMSQKDFEAFLAKASPEQLQEHFGA